jgi:hypothetical protein
MVERFSQVNLLATETHGMTRKKKTKTNFAKGKTLGFSCISVCCPDKKQ